MALSGFTYHLNAFVHKFQSAEKQSGLDYWIVFHSSLIQTGTAILEHARS